MEGLFNLLYIFCIFSERSICLLMVVECVGMDTRVIYEIHCSLIYLSALPFSQ